MDRRRSRPARARSTPSARSAAIRRLNGSAMLPSAFNPRTSAMAGVDRRDDRIRHRSIAHHEPRRQPRQDGRSRSATPAAAIDSIAGRDRVRDQPGRRFDDDRARVGPASSFSPRSAAVTAVLSAPGTRRRAARGAIVSRRHRAARRSRAPPGSRSRCSRASDTNTDRTGPCAGVSENSPTPSRARTPTLVSRIDRPRSSRLPCSESTGMSVGRASAHEQHRRRARRRARRRDRD